MVDKLATIKNIESKLSEQKWDKVETVWLGSETPITYGSKDIGEFSLVLSLLGVGFGETVVVRLLVTKHFSPVDSGSIIVYKNEVNGDKSSLMVELEKVESILEKFEKVCSSSTSETSLDELANTLEGLIG